MARIRILNFVSPMHKLSFGDPRIGAKLKGRGLSRWSQAGGVLNCGKKGACVITHAHLCPPFLQLISAKLAHRYARLGQGGSEHQGAAAKCVQGAKSCLSWAWSCSGTALLSRRSIRMRMHLHRGIYRVQKPTRTGRQLPTSIQI